MAPPSGRPEARVCGRSRAVTLTLPRDPKLYGQLASQTGGKCHDNLGPSVWACRKLRKRRDIAYTAGRWGSQYSIDTGSVVVLVAA